MLSSENKDFIIIIIITYGARPFHMGWLKYIRVYPDMHGKIRIVS